MSVFIVEDEQELLEAINEVFTVKGIACKISNSYAKAREALAFETFDFYILDIVLGNKPVGWDLIPLIRSKNPEAKIIISSGNIEKDDYNRPNIWKVCEKAYDVFSLADHIFAETVGRD